MFSLFQMKNWRGLPLREGDKNAPCDKMVPEEYRFSVDRIRSHFSRSELLSSLKEYARVHDCTSFGMRDYDTWRDRLATSDTFRRVFGSWGKALQLAGFRTVRGQKLDPQQMVGAFKVCWKEIGSVPSHRQLKDFLERHKFPFRTKSYLAYFGGLGPLARLIVSAQNGDISETKLFERHKPDRRVRRILSPRLRQVVFKRDAYRCVRCGADSKSARLEVDHIKPVSKGGDNALSNLRTLCDRCSLGRGNDSNL